MTAKLLFVCNNPAFFADQHLHLAVAARGAGYRVWIAAPDWVGAERIEELGFPFHPIRMVRGAPAPWKELTALGDLRRLYLALQPDLVYHVTLKPILFGTLAARMARIPAVINSNTGLGFAFIDDSIKTRLIRLLVLAVYRASIHHPNRCDLFLNHDDHCEFVRTGLADSDRSAVVNGPGVKLANFHPSVEPGGRLVFALPARLLWHKGVAEFVDAAHRLKDRGIDARCALVGDVDEGNLASVTRDQLRVWHTAGVVEWWGFCHDMPAVYERTHVVVLPSYREGLGKVLAEAGACGRSVIATDVPGCREIVDHGVNGLLVPARDSKALADAMETLARDRGMRLRMGRQGRRIVERRFSNMMVQGRTLAIIAQLLSGVQLTPGKLRLIAQQLSSDSQAEASIAAATG